MKNKLVTLNLLIMVIIVLLLSCVEPGEPITDTFTISGTVICNDAGLHNVVIKLVEDSDQMTTTNSEGYYEFKVENPGLYTIQPEKKGIVFAPSSHSVIVDATDITNRDFGANAMVGYRLDKWGYIWDETARTAMSWEAAKAICESEGGRLPTPTEIYRNRASTGTSDIAVPGDTPYLWTFIENSQNNYVCVRLSDGVVTNYGSTSNVSFRCVWPDKTHDYFTGSYVTTLPTEEDFTFTINGTEYIMDTYDRVALTYNEAVREATFYHAFIPTEAMYTAAIRAGLPNGTNEWCHTSDHGGYDSSNFCVESVRWTGIDTDFTDLYSTYSTWSYLTTRRAFRSIGIHMPVESHPRTIINEWVDPHTQLKSTNQDEGISSYINAIDFCFENGGHLPSHQELMILIQAGLPGGSNTWLWNAEYHNGNYVGVMRWPGVCPFFSGYYSPGYMTWTNPNSSTDSFRSVYYPINTSYNGPDASICEGGRFTVSKDIGNGNAVTMWSDNEDREPATFAEAISICHDLGGHLASRRDMVELIRNGLPNGMDQSEGENVWLWTSDRAYVINEVEVVKWQGTGTKSNFQDIYGTGVNDDCSEVVNSATMTLPYRCVWTNEIRVF